MPYQIQATSDGSETLYHTAYQQSFHSKHGAFTEAQHVFLRGAGVAERLLAGQATRILEVGFGTGLNFLVTADLAWQAQIPLHYVALEKGPLPSQILSRLNHVRWLEGRSLYKAFTQWYADLPPAEPRRPVEFVWSDLIRLTLVIGDATQVAIPALNYQAIYQDAFSPAVNPEPADFFGKLYPVLEPRGKLTTYSVKGAMRRALQQVGFQVEKRLGPPGKREILVAMRRS